MTRFPQSARPGPVAGLYPERRTEPLPALDQLAQEVGGYLRQIKGSSASAYRPSVARIERLGADLEELPLEELTRRALRLSEDMHRLGLTKPMIEASFALIREVSFHTMGKRHYPVQMIGAMAMLDGRIAQMATGEGKTLTATLAAATAALAGIPVHVVTVNDYLVARDAKEMAPLYTALGLTVAHVVPEMGADEKAAAYAADITYCSNKQVVFDYLRDRLAISGNRKLGNERRLLRGLCFAIVDEADSVLVDEARTPLIIAEQAGDNDARLASYREALDFAAALVKGRDFIHRVDERQIELTPAGSERLDLIGAQAGGIWRGKLRREELMTKALSAIHVFRRDHEYLVMDDKVHIIDEFTGRLMSDRSWEEGLHQLIETKEGVELTDRNVTRAKISYQAYFRRYVRLSGMTGTAVDIRGELWSVYRLSVVSVPTHRPVRRRELADRVHASQDAKWRATVAAAAKSHAEGRAVLIGTRSVAASEVASRHLSEAGLPHRVLSASQNKEEADIVALAGQDGAITVATNMAGRGTDIILSPGVAAAGGLHVVMTERHESRRIDRQLAGRSGRQGDPGVVEAHLAVDDDLMRAHCPVVFGALVSAMTRAGMGVDGPLGRVFVRRCQRKAERSDARTRRSVLKVDEKVGDLLAFAGRSD
ncbi:hypothetical protein [Pseudooceanicola sp. LIPI14-2-Ac024]|uniref:preprotein translocase subunit SecA n=1 Tax=Pseudooceanicola sp. LIPI14-2-Ac024 TaxID=3344875 RepID=UPI0035D09AF7